MEQCCVDMTGSISIQNKETKKNILSWCINIITFTALWFFVFAEQSYHVKDQHWTHE